MDFTRKDVLLAFVAGFVIHFLFYLIKKFIPWIRSKRGEVLPSGRLASIFWGVFWSLACAMIWSVSYVSLSWVTSKVDPFDMNVIMLGTASCFLLLSYVIIRVFSFWRSGSQAHTSQPPVNWGTMAPWVAVAGNLGNFVFFIYALYFVSASQAMALGEVSPVFVALLTWLWLRRSLPGTTISATVIAVLGVFLIMAEKDFGVSQGNATTYGSILALCGGASFAAFSAGLERIERVQQSLPGRLLFMGIAFAVAWGGVMAVGYLEHRIPATIDPGAMLILVLNGLRVAVVYLLYWLAVRYIGALLASILVTSEALFAMLWDSRLLHRHPVPNLIIGAVAILIAAFTLLSDRWKAMRDIPLASGSGAASAGAAKP